MEEFEFDERAIEVVFQDLPFLAAGWDVGVEEGGEVMFQGDCRKALAEALGFLSESGEDFTAGEIGPMPGI